MHRRGPHHGPGPDQQPEPEPDSASNPSPVTRAAARAPDSDGSTRPAAGRSDAEPAQHTPHCPACGWAWSAPEPVTRPAEPSWLGRAQQSMPGWRGSGDGALPLTARSRLPLPTSGAGPRCPSAAIRVQLRRFCWLLDRPTCPAGRPTGRRRRENAPGAGSQSRRSQAEIASGDRKPGVPAGSAEAQGLRAPGWPIRPSEAAHQSA